MVPEPRQALDRVAGQPAVAGAQVFGDRLHVWMHDADSQSAGAQLAAVARAASLTPASVRAIVPSLEDVFIARLAAEGAEATPGPQKAQNSPGPQKAQNSPGPQKAQ